MDLDFPIVGIGASAGGLESIEAFFDAVGDQPGMCFFVVQHLSPNHQSLMDQLVQRHTDLPVRLAEDGMSIATDEVVLLPPGKIMTVADGRVRLEEKIPDQLTRPIDIFLASLANHGGERTAAVILSGTGTDGTQGAAAVRRAGGLILAESHETARFYGMPKSVIDHDLSDAVMGPHEMPGALHRVFSGGSVQSRTDEHLDGFDAVVDALRLRFDVDFNAYRPATLLRRIERRAKIQDLAPDDYVQRVVTNPDALESLRDDLLINVTRPFRDAGSFRRLEAQLDALVGELAPSATLRVWCAGCATGDEAYSLAIAAREALERTNRAPRLKVFATDLNRKALQVARRRVFSDAEVRQVDADRVARFFERDGDEYRPRAEIREHIIFSPHDMTRDMPFNDVHLVSCRNVLIYLKRETQRRVLATFHYGLVPGGLLFLGGSETDQALEGAFRALDEPARIYRAVPFDLPAELSPRRRMRPRSTSPALPAESSSGGYELGRETYDALFERYLPPSILLDASKRVLRCFAGSQRFLSLKSGPVDTDIFSLLDAPFKGALATAFRAVDDNGTAARIERFLDDGTALRVERIIEAEGGRHRYLLVFEPEHPAPGSVARDVVQRIELNPSVDAEVQSLHQELNRTRVRLRSAIEDLEASNEELQTTNEELIASNEELQSTNEELSSVNEELYTVNTEYQSSIADLRRAHDDIERLLSSTEIVTLFLTSELRIRRFTPNVESLIDLEESDVGRPVTRFRHRLKWDDFYLALGSARDSGQGLEREVESEDGRRHLLRILPVRSSEKKDGETNGVTTEDGAAKAAPRDRSGSALTVTLTDISRTYEALAQVQDRERRLRRLTNALPTLIAFVDREERYQFVNARYGDVFGFDPTGKTLAERLGAERYAEVQPYAAEALAGTQVEFEISLAVRDAERRWLVTYVPYRGDDDVVEGFYSTATDITQRHQTALALERARGEEARASEAKTQFLANVSHEMRSPLTAMLGFTELLSGEVTSEKAKQYVATVDRNGRHLLYLVNDLLDLSRVEAGEIDTRQEAFSLPGLLWEVFDAFQIPAAEKELSFRLCLPERLPHPFLGDPLRIRQIVFNLVANAIKFTEVGSVALSVDYDADAGDVEISVEDTGIGFPQSQASALFRAFHQRDSGETRRYQGSGLGLAISAKLAALMGGEVHAQSAPGEGSTFTLVLPLEVADDATQVETQRSERDGAAARRPQLEGRVLVVDDSDDIRALVATRLRQAGADVVEAGGGHEALERLSSKPDFGLVLMDVQMPDLDGLEVTRRLRAAGNRVPIIALTARARPTDRDDCLAAGCDAFISKPIDTGLLLDSVNGFLAGDASRAPKVLIVEDDYDNAELLQLGFAARKLEAVVAHTLAETREALETFRPDVVVSDLNLSGGETGFDVISHVRRSGQAPHLIALSGAAELRSEALARGFDQFALKPCSVDGIIAMMRQRN
ncbi:MAG: chemotaxis protein CheB [Myxococcota bacterium]